MVGIKVALNNDNGGLAEPNRAPFKPNHTLCVSETWHYRWQVLTLDSIQSPACFCVPKEQVKPVEFCLVQGESLNSMQAHKVCITVWFSIMVN